MRQCNPAARGRLGDRLRRGYRSVLGRLWQARNRRRLAVPRGPAERVHFAIPLLSRRRAGNWAQVCANLAATLASLRAQTDPRWRAVICGQDRPRGLPDDPRIRFLPSSVTDRFNDQREKGRELVADLARGGDAGYYFKLDADDLLHPGLVAWLLGDDNGAGYLIDRGYMLDHGHLARTGALRLAVLAPRSPRYPAATEFYRQCGSCSALWFDFRNGADFAWLLNHRGSHVELDANLADFGFVLGRVPFPAAIYVMNHGDNMRARRGKIDAKMRNFERSPVAETTSVAAEFDLARYAGLAVTQVQTESG